MPRFFKEFFESAPFLDGEDAAHIIKSLRMRPGEGLTVCDTRGTDYHCTIAACADGRVELTVDEAVKNETEPSVFVTLFQCLPKGDKMDSVVRQSVELGASRIVPVLSDNCVSRPDAKSLAKKRERWQKIADEAAGQCGRGILPSVGECITLKAVSDSLSNFDRAFFCYELGGKPIRRIGSASTSIALIIGPEGGFTAKEAEMLESGGASVSTLGPRILRTETAPLAAITAVMLETGNMD